MATLVLQVRRVTDGLFNAFHTWTTYRNLWRGEFSKYRGLVLETGSSVRMLRFQERDVLWFRLLESRLRKMGWEQHGPAAQVRREQSAVVPKARLCLGHWRAHNELNTREDVLGELSCVIGWMLSDIFLCWSEKSKLFREGRNPRHTSTANMQGPGCVTS